MWVLASALILCLIAPAVSATDGIEWQHVLGGKASEIGYSGEQTREGGYILTGSTASNNTGDVTHTNHGGTDVWVVQLTAAGTIVWNKVLGGSGTDIANNIRQTNDGGYILAGYTSSNTSGDVAGVNHGMNDAWVVKLDPAGTVQWQRSLGGNMDDLGYSILQTGDGGYIMAGSTRSNISGDITGVSHGSADVWVVKLDPAGSVQWQRPLGGGAEEGGKSIQPTNDGGYILAGYTLSNRSADVGINHGSADVWVVKLNSAGTMQWQKVLGGSGNEYGQSIQQAGDGGYIVAGGTNSVGNGDVIGTNHGGIDAWVVKLDPAGTLQWERSLGGNSYDFGFCIRQTGDGMYILAGDTYSSANGDVTGTNHGGYDAWVVKLDSGGTIKWDKVLGGSATEHGYSIWPTSDGGHLMTGYSESSESGDVTEPRHGSSEVWVVKLIDNAPKTLPGCTSPPTDPDGDGIYEDLNGNGRMDFADVVLYFTQMSWIAANEPVGAFDLNGNGRIDFADIVALFNEI